MKIFSLLIPIKFIALISHFAIIVCLLWGSQQSVRSCLMGMDLIAQPYAINYHSQIVTGLSIAVGLISFEMLAFLTGFTMFHHMSALISIGLHTTGSIFLGTLFVDNWPCDWFWWAFTYSSIIPALYELRVVEKPPAVKPRWTCLLILAGMSTTIGSALVVGYNIGVINAPQQIIKNFCSWSMYTRFGISLNKGELDILWAAVVSVFLIGGAIGSLTGSLLANRLGRKGAITTSSLLASLAALSLYASRDINSVELLIAGRFLAGLAGGLTTCVMPMYLTELAPLELRGSVGVFCPLGVTFGILVGQIMSLREILGTEKLWPLLLSVYLIPVLVCAIAIPYIPESPKYLYIIRKQPHMALRQLSRIRGVPEEHLDDELQELQREEEDCALAAGNDWSLGRILKDKYLKLPLLLVCFLQVGQQFSGINSVFYYSVSIFEAAGLSNQHSQLASIGAGTCNFLMAVISIPVMSKFNRRCTILTSLFLTVFFLILLGSTILLIPIIHWMSYVSIVAVLGFVICYGIGLGPIPYFIGAELFEVGPRPAAMALGSMCNWGGNFFIGLTFPTMKTFIGASSFFLFAALTAALFLFMKYYLPETRNKDVTEIAHICRKGFSSKPLGSSASSTSTTDRFSPPEIKNI